MFKRLALILPGLTLRNRDPEATNSPSIEGLVDGIYKEWSQARRQSDQSGSPGTSNSAYHASRQLR
jgi:hypothetical protein